MVWSLWGVFHQDMMSLWCSFHLLLWNAGHQIARWNMTGCDIAVEHRRLGSLGPLTQFRYLSCHFSKVIKIATQLPIIGYIRSLAVKKERKKTSCMCWSAFNHTPCCHQCLTSAVSPVSKISLLLHSERQKETEWKKENKTQKN